MHIKCTNGSPLMDKLDHLLPLPLAVQYMTECRGVNILTEQDRLGLYNALRLHDRVHHIDLELPPSIWLQVLPLMDKHFPILKCLRLSFMAESTSIQLLTLPILRQDLRNQSFLL